MQTNTIQQSVLSELERWIKNNLEKKLTIDALSTVSGYSQWHLFRLFRHYFNMSPMEYIRQQRMRLCRDLLQARPAFRIVDICIMVGYEDISAFNRTFKKYHAVTPTQFRENVDLRIPALHYADGICLPVISGTGGGDGTSLAAPTLPVAVPAGSATGTCEYQNRDEAALQTGGCSQL